MGRVRMPDVEDEAPKLKATAEVVLKLPPPVELIEAHYRQNHVNLHLLGREVYGLRRLYDALASKGARLKERNKFIQSPNDAVRWIFEQIDDAYGK